MAPAMRVDKPKKVALLARGAANSFNLFSRQERLAIIVVAAETGTPVNRVPVYAEITAELIAGPQRSTPSLDDGLAALDVVDQKKHALATALRKEIDWPRALRAAGNDEVQAKSRLNLMLLAVTVIAQHAGDPDSHLTLDEWVKYVVSKAKSLPEFRTLEGADDNAAATRLSVPLGVLATDHTGFVSFDITKYRDVLGARNADGAEVRSGIKFSLQVYPGLLEKTKFNALEQGRVTPDVVVAKYEMAQADFSAIPSIGIGLPSMQNPSLAEWRLSPGSFAAVPQSLIGTDGCESLTPANFAVAQFNLRQVIRLAPEPGDTPSNPIFPKGLIHEYTLSLIPIGHSLGSILYSLPLAPGESVRLAVIDWRRTDVGQRDEKTVITESLLHEQTRDRAISETVSAALDEWQRGGSVMGGMAAGAGASGTTGAYGVAGGGMASIGGAYTTSSGTRNLTAESLQKVADAVHQASSDTREMQNSVVVQIDSKESETVQTRTFFNNNRGHTMTVLYYEMLRHFRMVVHFNRQYKALLVPRTPWVFDSEDHLILNKEYILSPALLDDSLRPAFDAVRRADMVRQDLIRNPPPKASTDNPGDFLIVSFRMFFRVGGVQSSNALQMQIVTKLNPVPTELKLHGQGNINADPTPFDRDSSGSGFVIATDPMTPLKWSDLTQFIFRKASGSDDVAVYELSIDAVGSNGDIKNVHRQIPGDYYYLKEEGEQFPLTVVFPPPAPPAQPEATWQRVVSLEDFSAVMRLRAHINANLEYYTRLLDLSVHPNEYATRFESIRYDTRMLIDVVSPCPAEILGTKIAFPLLDQGSDDGPQDIPDEERLISLPTRGVFAEAKLGHCNVAEEIDDTRFWKWDEHQNPMLATEIQPVKVAEPTPATNLPLAPNAMPQSIVNIQQPLALPDPTGLAAALKAISTPNIFRDMSGATEVQQLLHDLIEGSVSMAQAASAAKNIQAKQNAGGGGGGGSASGGQAASDPVVSQAQAEDNRTLDQQVSPANAQHAIQLANNQAQKGTITKAQAADIAANQLSNMKGSQQPKPLPKAPKKWYFEVTLRGYGNMVLDGMWSWELSQGGTSLGFELMDKRPNGVIKIPFVLEGNDRRFKLSVSGQILSGYGIDANFSGKEILFEVPVETFNNSNYAYITLEAIVATYKFTTTSSDALKKAWTKNAGLTVSPPDAVKQIVNITGQAGETWGRDETHTTQNAEEWMITYYPGGFNLREVK